MLKEFSFLKTRSWQILTLIMLAQAAFYYGRAKSVEHVPIVKPLAAFPSEIASWRLAEEGVVEQEVRDVLRADDLLNRLYRSASYPVGINLFIGYFKSQRTGVAPHSPKNCLPGSGWEPSESGVMNISLGEGKPTIEVNRYMVARGQNKSLVAYWYQSRNRVVASEYTAKIQTVMDSIRYNRTDTAIVRVVVPVVNEREEDAEKQVAEFVRAMFPELMAYFPA
ncbi:MAG: EpsI family protein [Bryobacterales bacterium]|nr:EpsI family protein [Bryobacterales bacterium]